MALRIVPCPQCGKSTAYDGNPFRPFCSDRCRQIDLGNWADEEYRIPSQPAPEPDADQPQGD